MLIADVHVGAKVWYLYYPYGRKGMTYQKQVKVLAVKGDRVKVEKDDGNVSWVHVKNLRLTP